MTPRTIDTMTIEARARALRAAYIRDAVWRLVARLRGGNASGDAHA